MNTDISYCDGDNLPICSACRRLLLHYPISTIKKLEEKKQIWMLVPKTNGIECENYLGRTDL